MRRTLACVGLLLLLSAACARAPQARTQARAQTYTEWRETHGFSTHVHDDDPDLEWGAGGGVYR